MGKGNQRKKMLQCSKNKVVQGQRPTALTERNFPSKSLFSLAQRPTNVFTNFFTAPTFFSLFNHTNGAANKEGFPHPKCV